MALAEVIDMTVPAGSPDWWRDRLLEQLELRVAEVTRLEAYYDGDHPLPRPPQRLERYPQAVAAFETLSHVGITNYMPPVADQPAQRLEVLDFRTGSDGAEDKAMRELWKRAHLDADSMLVHHGALVTGQSFVLVWRSSAGVEITTEHPSQAIVAYRAGSRRERVAGLKAWAEDDETRRVVLYLPDSVYKWRSETKGPTAPLVPWQPGTDDTWPIKNPMGAVPLVEFRPFSPAALRPAPFGGGRSEFAGVIVDQNRINKTVFDRLVTAEYQAFRQRWAIGWTPDDPNDAITASMRSLWTFPNDDNNVTVGEFAQADFSGFLNAVAADVKHIAVQTSTPFYTLGELANPPSGDALMAIQSGLVAKTEAHARQFGESWEEVRALALGDAAPAAVVWGSVAHVTWAEKADAAVKLKAVNVPDEAIWAMLGFKPEDIDNFKVLRADQTLFAPSAPAVG